MEAVNRLYTTRIYVIRGPVGNKESEISTLVKWKRIALHTVTMCMFVYVTTFVWCMYIKWSEPWVAIIMDMYIHTQLYT